MARGNVSIRKIWDRKAWMEGKKSRRGGNGGRIGRVGRE